MGLGCPVFTVLPRWDEKVRITAGLDLGDRYTHLCLIDTHSGEVIEETRLATSPEAFERRFSTSEPIRVAIEASTHSIVSGRLWVDTESGCIVTPRLMLQLAFRAHDLSLALRSSK